MKKVKREHTQRQKKPMDLKTKVILFTLLGIGLVAIIFLMFLESSKEKIIMKNNTDLKLEYVKAYFVDPEGPLSDNVTLVENLEPGDKIVNDFAEINLFYREANLEIRFKFENHEEIFVDAGIFNDIFSGKVNIEFDNSKQEDIIKLKVKASNGILPTPLIECNEVFDVYYNEGYVAD